jgi:hypothetical protein
MVTPQSLSFTPLQTTSPNEESTRTPRRENYQNKKNDYTADGNFIRNAKRARRLNEFCLPNLSSSIQIDGNQMQLKSNIEAYLPQHISCIPYITPKLSQLGSN